MYEIEVDAAAGHLGVFQGGAVGSFTIR